MLKNDHYTIKMLKNNKTGIYVGSIEEYPSIAYQGESQEIVKKGIERLVKIHLARISRN
jgi:predicted RNase H-like HicB family nuclease